MSIGTSASCPRLRRNRPQKSCSGGRDDVRCAHIRHATMDTSASNSPDSTLAILVAGRLLSDEFVNKLARLLSSLGKLSLSPLKLSSVVESAFESTIPWMDLTSCSFLRSSVSISRNLQRPSLVHPCRCSSSVTRATFSSASHRWCISGVIVSSSISRCTRHCTRQPSRWSTVGRCLPRCTPGGTGRSFGAGCGCVFQKPATWRAPCTSFLLGGPFDRTIEDL